MKETLNLALRLSLICAVAALALTQVDSFTSGPIAEAEAKAQREAVKQVLPEFASLNTDTLRSGAEDQAIYFTGQGEAGPVGTAFTSITDKGYSGEMEIMIGLDAEGTVNGIRILRHAETPGLGSNYALPEKLNEFYKGRDASTNWDVDTGDIDAITGATVTGRAMCDAIKKGFEKFEADRKILQAPKPEPKSDKPAGGSQ